MGIKENIDKVEAVKGILNQVKHFIGEMPSILDDTAKQIVSLLFPVSPKPKCGKCGGAMSLNPHLDAGKPPHYLEVGTKYVCIPCTCKGLHNWAERSMKAETELANIPSPVPPELTVLSDEEIEVWLKDRLGEGNRFDQFNRKFCRDLAQAQLAHTKEELKGRNEQGRKQRGRTSGQRRSGG